jgi:hypothetical protein
MNNITWVDIVTLIIAIWGAGLSTFLGIREFLKDRRKIQIFLEHVYWTERIQLRIVNTGHRPITIQDISMRVYTVSEDPEYKNKLGHWEGMPKDILLSYDNPEEVRLPITINDGEQAIIPLSDYVGSTIFRKGSKADIQVVDNEGRIHKKFKMIYHDPKWGMIGNKR